MADSDRAVLWWCKLSTLLDFVAKSPREWSRQTYEALSGIGALASVVPSREHLPLNRATQAKWEEKLNSIRSNQHQWAEMAVAAKKNH